LDINAKSITLHEAAESLGCDIEKIRDLVRTNQTEIFLLIDDSFDGERRKIRTGSNFSNRTVEDIVQGLEGPLLFPVSAKDMDDAIGGYGIGFLNGHWNENPDLLGSSSGGDFIDYTFRPAHRIKLPLSSPLWRIRLDQIDALRSILLKNIPSFPKEREGFGYFQFIKLLHVKQEYLGDNGKIYFGFKIKSDGIWMLPPGHEYHQSNHNLEAFYEGFDVHDLEKKPVLAFPCTESELKLFLQKSGLDGMIDPDVLKDIEDAIASRERARVVDDQPPASTVPPAQPTANQAEPVVELDVDKQELESLKTKPGALEPATKQQLLKLFDYGPNSFSGVVRRLEDYNKRFPENPFTFHRGKGGSPCLYHYEAWFVKSKVGGASGNRKPRKSSQKKT
jgi:hypothetical protein